MAGTIDILSQIANGIKKYPGNAIGAPVDLINTILNMGMLKTGTDEPVGGSAWINKKFGLGSSSGPADDITQLVTGFMTPGNMATLSAAAKTAIFVPALLTKEASAVEAATRFLAKGADRQAVYNNTGIFKDTFQPNAPLKAVIDDSGATFKTTGPGAVIRSQQNPFKESKPLGYHTEIPDGAYTLDQVIDHPELFKAAPWTKDILIDNRAGIGNGAYYPITKDISVGKSYGSAVSDNATATTADESLMSVILHEVGHAVDAKYGFSSGGNPGMFIRDRGRIDQAQVNAIDAGDKTSADQLKMLSQMADDQYRNIPGELSSSTVQYMRANPTNNTVPSAIMEKMAKKTGAPVISVNDLSSVPKLEDTALIKSILDKYTPQTNP